jgi:hypothetical protein
LRSPHEPIRGLLFAACLLTLPPTAAPAVPCPSVKACAPVTVDGVRGAVADLRADPDFRGRKTERQLRWIHDDAPPPEAPPNWLFGLVRWLADGARWLMWLLGAIAVALILVFAWRWIRVGAEELRGRSAPRPSHVNDLDIRPESLPDDISGAARSFLQRSDPRGALSLLYRGTLSRLVHDHHLAIRAASTEGECLRLAQRALAADQSAYFERLVQAWQTEVYADRRNAVEVVAALCTQFDAHFAAAPVGPAPAAGAPA